MKKLALILVLVSLFAVNSYAENYSLEFDGSDDYVVVPDSDDWVFGTSDFTIEGWLQFNAIDKSQTFYSQFIDRDNFGNIGINANNTLQIGYLSSDIGEASFNMTNAWSGLAIDTWYHVAFVRSSNTCLMFIDGVSQTPITTHAEFGDLDNYAADLIIGSFILGGSACFDGYLDELRIWDIARTEEEIQSWMDYELFGNEPDLVAYWNFDEGSENILHDLSGNGHNGTIYGAQWTEEGAPVGVIPEPSSLMLLSFGLLGAGFFKRKRR